MAISFFWTCESLTLSSPNDLPGTDTSASQNGTTPASISATAALIGSNGILVSTSTDNLRLDAETGVIDRLAGSCAFWFRVQTWPALHTFLYFRGAAFGDNLTIIGIGSSGSGNLRFKVNDGGTGESSLDLTGNAIALNTSYFCTFSWDQPANSRRLRLYNSSGTLIDSTQDTSTAFTAPADLVSTDGLRFGETASQNAAFYLDNIFIGKAYADADTFLTNRSITSYTSYSAGGASRPMFRGS